MTTLLDYHDPALFTHDRWALTIPSAIGKPLGQYFGQPGIGSDHRRKAVRLGWADQSGLWRLD
jgi:hypothetical protein